jgi:probable phosphoglycerate mutase
LAPGPKRGKPADPVLEHFPTVPDLLIIRHGQSEWNLERRWQGWKDAPLTSLGVQQARERAADLLESGFRPMVVHSSDLGRARQTASLIAEQLGAPVRTDEGFRERSGGEWEGHTVEELQARWPDQYAAWRAGDRFLPPGSEPDQHVLDRFDAALERSAAGVPGIVVTHGGALHLVATRAGVPVEALIPNLCGYWFSFDGRTLTDPEPIPPLAVPTEAPATE